MLSSLMRAVGFASKLAPRITRGIGQAAAITRNIGQGARTVRDIGQAVNSVRLPKTDIYDDWIGNVPLSNPNNK